MKSIGGYRFPACLSERNFSTPQYGKVSRNMRRLQGKILGRNIFSWAQGISVRRDHWLPAAGRLLAPSLYKQIFYRSKCRLNLGSLRVEREVKAPIAAGSFDAALPKSGARDDGKSADMPKDAPEAMNICICCDRRYLQHAGVTLVSILENNPAESVHAYLLLTEQLADDDVRKITGSVEKYQNCELHMINITVDIASPKVLVSRLSNAIYARLWIDRVIPDTVKKILYLDCDIVVCGSLRALYDLDVSGYLAAAVPDYWEKIRPELGFAELGKYINSGVMLINLPRWKDEEISRKIQDFILFDSAKIVHGDQCAINAILIGKVLLIGMEWNYQVGLVRSGVFVPQGPKIIHYSASAKPWMYDNTVAYKSLYDKYLAKTMWRSYVAPDFSRKTQIKQFLRRLVLAGLVFAGRRSHEW